MEGGEESAGDSGESEESEEEGSEGERVMNDDDNQIENTTNESGKG